MKSNILLAAALVAGLFLVTGNEAVAEAVSDCCAAFAACCEPAGDCCP